MKIELSESEIEVILKWAIENDYEPTAIEIDLMEKLEKAYQAYNASNFDSKVPRRQ